MVCFRLMKI